VTFTIIARTPGRSQHNRKDKLLELHAINKYQHGPTKTTQSKTTMEIATQLKQLTNETQKQPTKHTPQRAHLSSAEHSQSRETPTQVG